MKIRHERLLEEIEEIRRQISELPEGEICCAKNGNRYKWYHCRECENTTIYIPKSNRNLAEELTYKKYLTLQLEEYVQEKNAIESYLKKCRNENSKLNNFLKHSEYQKLLFPHLDKTKQEIIRWMNEPYEKCDLYPEHLIHKTITGEMVRSKSESFIYMYLKLNDIPFRYECPLELGKMVYYPDFTIRHPKTGEFYYWENHGMMDDPAYVQKTFNKMQIYTLHGIIPGKQLITTYETTKDPLNVEDIQRIVRQYFLN